MTYHTKSDSKHNFAVSLLSGAVAGTTVDVALYPLDTIKTRIQSSQGFLKAGGFRGVYKGLSAVALGSAPGAALFFCAYDSLKHSIRLQTSSSLPDATIHAFAASAGEVVACMVRVPTEVVKQRMQVGQGTAVAVVQAILSSPIGVRGLYTGFGITVMREIPFSFIQFPIYELLKSTSRKRSSSEPIALEAALYGSLSGGFSAALTNPLDVIKTRLMLAEKVNGVKYHGARDALKRILAEEGVSALFKGISPRVMWISIGGFVFFGAYEQSKTVFTSYFVR